MNIFLRQIKKAYLGKKKTECEQKYSTLLTVEKTHFKTLVLLTKL